VVLTSLKSVFRLEKQIFPPHLAGFQGRGDRLADCSLNVMTALVGRIETAECSFDCERNELLGSVLFAGGSIKKVRSNKGRISGRICPTQAAA
jgi:hypothetical protein